jgi:hypothetical protein
MIIQNKDIGFSNNASNWDIHPDGKRFLMMKSPTANIETEINSSLRKINIVLNWSEELKERVPAE